MRLRFILGPAGTGKTNFCLEQIQKALLERPEGPAIILLVPEAAIFPMKTALTSLPGLQGSMRTHIFSFSRLAQKVSGEVGGFSRPYLRTPAKRMAGSFFLQRRERELRVFARAARQPTFPAILIKTITEMKRYGLTKALLKSTAKKFDNGPAILRDKLEDLALLWSDLERFLGTGYRDPDDDLNLLVEQLGQSSTYAQAEVWVDGFSTFTPQEYRVLRSFLLKGHQVHITLCMPADLKAAPKETDLFFKPYKTYTMFLNLAEEVGVAVERVSFPHVSSSSAPRFKKNPSLDSLAQNFSQSMPQVYPVKPTGVKIVAAHNPLAEVEGVARKLIQLARKSGYRWKEMALWTRDLPLYAPLIQRVFADYRIPVFIAYKPPVGSHPLVELLCAALEIVVSGWESAAVFRFLKTDLVPLARDAVDRLENYVLAHGFEGNRWLDPEPWPHASDYTENKDSENKEFAFLENVTPNTLKEQVKSILEPFAAAIAAQPTVYGLSLALYNLMRELRTWEQLENWDQEVIEPGQGEATGTHGQIYQQVITCLDDLVETLGEQPISPKAYLEVLRTALQDLRLSLEPPGLDQVWVGALEGDFFPEVEANFLLGVNEGVLPRQSTEPGIFTDVEITGLCLKGLKLPPDRKQRLFQEQYLIYQALTRARTYLCVSYALADQEGKALHPSPLISQLREIFPKNKNENWTLEPENTEKDWGFIVNPGKTCSYLILQLRKAQGEKENLTPLWQEVYNWSFKQKDFRAYKKAFTALAHCNQAPNLSRRTCQQLYGRRLRTSVTQIERFRACPFSYFLAFGLRLEERAEAKISPLNLGQLFHMALKDFVQEIERISIDWREVTAEMSDRLADKISAQLLAQLYEELGLTSARQRYLGQRLQRIIQSSAWALVEQVQAGAFRPLHLELAFGDAGGLPALLIPAAPSRKESLGILVGRIDRLDIARSPEGDYVRIIDYKSGATGIDLNDFYYGLQIQLFAYLEAVLAGAADLGLKRIKVGGVCYFRFQDPVILAASPLTPDQVTEERQKRYKLKGLLLRETHLVDLMEPGLAGTSRFIPVGRKKDGDFTRYSSLMTMEQLNLLRQYLYHVLRTTGEKIMQGIVAIQPYQRKKRRACTYCAFKAVCQFDFRSGNRYQVQKQWPVEAIWELLDAKVKENAMDSATKGSNSYPGM